MTAVQRFSPRGPQLIINNQAAGRTSKLKSNE